MIGAMLLLAAAPIDFLVESGDLSADDSRKAVSDYARCVVKKRRVMASDAVVSTVGNYDLLKAYPKLIDSDCVSGQVGRMAFAGDLFRYAMADALLRDEIATQPTVEPNLLAPIDHYEPTEMPSMTNDKGRRISKKKYEQSLRYFGTALAYAQVSRFGECVVRANPAGAKALLLTDVTTDAERAAMVPLNLALANCLNAGERLTLTKEVLRGTVALNYYRLSKAKRIEEAAS